MSSRPSPSRSPSASPNGWFVAARSTFGPKLPVPVPDRTEIVLEA